MLAPENEDGVLFSMTTFLSLPNKLTQAVNAFSSVVNSHSSAECRVISRWLVINEIPKMANDGVNWEQRFRTELRAKGVNPQILTRLEFIQKTDDHTRGQPRSLNMILDCLRNDQQLTQWLHWEESWSAYTHLPFFHKIMRTLRDDPHVSQLQLSNDWHDTPEPRKRLVTHIGTTTPYVLITAGQSLPWYEALATKQTGPHYKMWPLFSLRPFIAKSAAFISIGDFSTDPGLFPVLFEWEIAVKWLRQHERAHGARTSPKAVLLHAVAQRQQGHVSTYHH